MIDEPFTLDPLPLEDLSTTLSARPAERQLFAKGTVTAWDASTRRGTVVIAGATFTDLSALDTSALTTLAENNTVLILKLNQSWLIVGRILDPL